MVKSSVQKQKQDRLLIPALNFRFGPKVLEKELYDSLGKKFGLPRKKVAAAIQQADAIQDRFEKQVRERGKEVLANLDESRENSVILGRPYNTGDPSLNLSMVEKLIKQDVVPIPTDYLALQEEHITRDYNKMYWPNGQKILAATRIIARDRRLHGIYMGNFRCGPDSFLSISSTRRCRANPTWNWRSMNTAPMRG